MIASVMANRNFAGNSDERNLRPYFDRGRAYDVYYPQQQTFYYGLFLFIQCSFYISSTLEVPRIFGANSNLSFVNLSTKKLVVLELCMKLIMMLL